MNANIQLYSLSEDYKNHRSDIGNYLKLFFGLPFLHPDDVQDCFIDDLLPSASVSFGTQLGNTY